MSLLTPAFNPEKWIWPNVRDLLDGQVMGLSDLGPPPDTHVLISGAFNNPGPVVQPGFVRAFSESDNAALFHGSDAVGETSGRRLALARWLTVADTPAAGLVSRVMVNRLWQHLFGRGIVATPDNFGVGGARPTHPDLIEHLAGELAHHGWHRKQVIRKIVTSTVYRQASTQVSQEDASKTKALPPAPSAVSGRHLVDPENHLLWRMPLRRLESEVIRDAMMSVSGRLNHRLGGPPIPLTEFSLEVKKIDIEKLSAPADLWRRSIYLSGKGLREGMHLTLLSVFDQPIMTTNCIRRRSSNVVTQSLTLLNDAFVLENADAFARRVQDLAGPDLRVQIDTAFRIALGRPAQPDEIAWSVTLLQDQTAAFHREPVSPEQASEQALATLCHALLNSSNFLYLE